MESRGLTVLNLIAMLKEGQSDIDKSNVVSLSLIQAYTNHPCLDIMNILINLSSVDSGGIDEIDVKIA